MSTLNKLLTEFLTKHEWNINKLKGGDVFYYVQENLNTEQILTIPKKMVENDSYINEYSDLVIPDNSDLFNILIEDDVELAKHILKDLH